jgi:hypothetical protein
MSADLWFRPYRSLIDWYAYLKRCNLPTLAARITNDTAEARRFAETWSGSATYAPLTSVSRYPLTDEAQWSELDNVVSRVPVCVMEPVPRSSTRACLVDREVVWNYSPDVAVALETELEAGIRQLGRMLEVTTLEVEFGLTRSGLCCTGVDLFPVLDRYSPAKQRVIVERIVDCLGVAA